jgi:hypothetical protein
MGSYSAAPYGQLLRRVQRRCGDRAVGSCIAVENVADPRHHLFAEAGHRAFDHVVGHGAELEDRCEPPQVELAREAKNGVGHRPGAAWPTPKESVA